MMKCCFKPQGHLINVQHGEMEEEILEDLQDLSETEDEDEMVNEAKSVVEDDVENSHEEIAMDVIKHRGDETVVVADVHWNEKETGEGGVIENMEIDGDMSEELVRAEQQ